MEFAADRARPRGNPLPSMVRARDSNPITASNEKYFPKWKTSLGRRVKNNGRKTLGVRKIAKYRYIGRIQSGRNVLRSSGLRWWKKEEKNKRVRHYGWTVVTTPHFKRSGPSRAGVRVNDTPGHNVDWLLFRTATHNTQKTFPFMDKNMEKSYMLDFYKIFYP